MANELMPFEVPAGMMEQLKAAFPAEMNDDLAAGVSDSVPSTYSTYRKPMAKHCLPWTCRWSTWRHPVPTY